MQEVIEVESTTLDSFLRERGIESVDFIRMDVEGAEPLVLAGMKDSVAHSPPLTMLLEYNLPALRCGDVPPQDFLCHLQQLGFEVQAILADVTLGGPPNSEGYDVVNLLACKFDTNQSK